MTKQQLLDRICEKRSFLCVGLDTDIRKLPPHLMEMEDPMLTFNKEIIDATAPYCVSFKPNLAFYESMGSYGLKVFEETVNYLRTNYPHHLIIADGKRGDIGNTGNMYARAFFEHFKVDALTISPYMGADSISPFLQYGDKWTILLALTSNTGASDFQLSKNENGEYLFESVIRKAIEVSSKEGENLMFVVGATQTEFLRKVRNIAPKHFLLVPGIGAQGGDFETLITEGMTEECGLLVNSSRGIIYADNGENYASFAKNEAHKLQILMEEALKNKNII